MEVQKKFANFERAVATLSDEVVALQRHVRLQEEQITNSQAVSAQVERNLNRIRDEKDEGHDRHAEHLRYLTSGIEALQEALKKSHVAHESQKESTENHAEKLSDVCKDLNFVIDALGLNSAGSSGQPALPPALKKQIAGEAEVAIHDQITSIMDKFEELDKRIRFSTRSYELLDTRVINNERQLGDGQEDLAVKVENQLREMKEMQRDIGAIGTKFESMSGENMRTLEVVTSALVKDVENLKDSVAAVSMGTERAHDNIDRTSESAARDIQDIRSRMERILEAELAPLQQRVMTVVEADLNALRECVASTQQQLPVLRKLVEVDMNTDLIDLRSRIDTVVESDIKVLRAKVDEALSDDMHNLRQKQGRLEHIIHKIRDDIEEHQSQVNVKVQELTGPHWHRLLEKVDSLENNMDILGPSVQDMRRTSEVNKKAIHEEINHIVQDHELKYENLVQKLLALQEDFDKKVNALTATMNYKNEEMETLIAKMVSDLKEHCDEQNAATDKKLDTKITECQDKDKELEIAQNKEKEENHVKFATHSEKINNLSNAHADLAERHQRLDERCHTVFAESAAHRARHADLAQKHAELKESVTDEKRSNETSFNTIHNQFAHVTKDTENKFKEHGNAHKILVDKHDSLHASVNSVSEKVRDHADKHSELAGKHQSLRSFVDEKFNEAHSTQEDLSRRSKELQLKHGDLSGSFENAHQEWKIKQDDLFLKHKDLYDAHHTFKNATDNTITEHAQQAKSLKKSIDDLTASHETNTHNFDKKHVELSRKQMSLGTTVEDLNQHLEDRHSEITRKHDELKSTVDSHAREHYTKHTEISRKHDDFSKTVEAKFSETHNSINNKHADLDKKFHLKHRELHEKHSDLHNKSKEMSDKFSELHSKVLEETNRQERKHKEFHTDFEKKNADFVTAQSELLEKHKELSDKHSTLHRKSQDLHTDLSSKYSEVAEQLLEARKNHSDLVQLTDKKHNEIREHHSELKSSFEDLHQMHETSHKARHDAHRDLATQVSFLEEKLGMKFDSIQKELSDGSSKRSDVEVAYEKKHREFQKVFDARDKSHHEKHGETMSKIKDIEKLIDNKYREMHSHTEARHKEMCSTASLNHQDLNDSIDDIHGKHKELYQSFHDHHNHVDKEFCELRSVTTNIAEQYRDLHDRWRNSHLEIDAREKELRGSYQSHVKQAQEKLAMADRRHEEVINKIASAELSLENKHEQLHENVHALKQKNQEAISANEIKIAELKILQDEHHQHGAEVGHRLHKDINELRSYQDQRMKEVSLSNDKKHREQAHVTESKISEVRSSLDAKYNEFERAFHLTKAGLERNVNSIHVKTHSRLEELTTKLNHVHESLGNDLTTAKELVTSLFREELHQTDENRQRDIRKLQHSFDKLQEQISSTDVQVRESIQELRNKIFEEERFMETHDRDMRKLYDGVNDQINIIKCRQQEHSDQMAEDNRKLILDAQDRMKTLEDRLSRRADEQTEIIQDLTERLIANKKNLAEQQSIYSSMADDHSKRLQEQLNRHRDDQAGMIDTHGKQHADNLKTMEVHTQSEIDRLTRRLDTLQDLAAEAMEIGKRGTNARDRMAESSDANFEALRTALEQRTDELSRSLEKVQKDVIATIDNEANVRNDMSKVWSTHLKEVGDGQVVACQAMETLQKRLELLEKSFDNNRMATSDEIVTARRDVGDMKSSLQQSIREARADNQASIAENMVAMAEKQLRTEESIHELRRMLDNMKSEHQEAVGARLVALEESSKARLDNSLVGVESATAHSVSVAEERIKTFFESHRQGITSRQDHLQQEIERMVTDVKDAAERSGRAREVALKSHMDALQQDIRELQIVAENKEAQRILQGPTPETLKLQQMLEETNTKCNQLAKQNADLVGKVEALTQEVNNFESREKTIGKHLNDMNDFSTLVGRSVEDSKQDNKKIKDEIEKNMSALVQRIQDCEDKNDPDKWPRLLQDPSGPLFRSLKDMLLQIAENSSYDRTAKRVGEKVSGDVKGWVTEMRVGEIVPLKDKLDFLVMRLEESGIISKVGGKGSWWKVAAPGDTLNPNNSVGASGSSPIRRRPPPPQFKPK